VADLALLRSVEIGDPTIGRTPEQWLDLAQAGGGWLVFHCRDVDGGSPGGGATSEQLDRTVTRARDLGFEVLPCATRSVACKAPDLRPDEASARGGHDAGLPAHRPRMRTDRGVAAQLTGHPTDVGGDIHHGGSASTAIVRSTVDASGAGD
jgi:hypothetical protein